MQPKIFFSRFRKYVLRTLFEAQSPPLKVSPIFKRLLKTMPSAWLSLGIRQFYDSFRADRLLDLIIFRIFRINPPTQIYRDRSPRPDLPAIRTDRPTPSISIMFSSRSPYFKSRVLSNQSFSTNFYGSLS